MISCYGFGYNLNSELLMNLSNISGGDGYSFIPDASILGNVFIHGLSNLFTTATHNPKLKISLKKDIRFADTGAKEIEFNLDSLKYGQEKNLVFDLDTSSRPGDHIELTDFSEVSLSFGDVILTSKDTPMPDVEYYTTNKFRYGAISVINQCIQKKKYNDNSFIDILNEFITRLEGEQGNVYIMDLLYDMNGQVKESLNMTSQGQREDWFTKWGIHYLRSLQGAYQHELCNNFKDRGICKFGGELFNHLRNEISDVFDGQPPPKRDIVAKRATSRRALGLRSPLQAPQAPQAQAAPVSMSVYNNASGGCCAEGSRVLMGDHSYKNVEDIEKGDRVVTCKINNGNLEYSVSPIECVVKTKCKGNSVKMVTIGKLRITPYHPIIQCSELGVTKDWVFPCTINEPIKIECSYMYTFVVENRDSMFIERSIFATYGHNLTEEIVQHEYFGTDNVINDLKKYPSYGQGLVELTQVKFVVDADKNQVIGIV